MAGSFNDAGRSKSAALQRFWLFVKLPASRLVY